MSTLGALGIGVGSVAGLQSAGAAPATAAVPGSSSAQLAPALSFGRHGSGAYGYGGFDPGAYTGPGGYTGGSSSRSTASTATATADQEIGIVDIDTVLSYQGAQAAGTGMVLTSDGEVLTNNHVVDGATSIIVTVVSSGTTYTATVVGTDPSDDVAVLRLTDATGLQTADIGTAAATVGEAVTAVGNAGGDGGSSSAATGTITALARSITATDESGSDAERLTGLLETDADVVAGDSGGPLYDTASGHIIGMDTAASTGGDVQGYAIPIATALSIAGQIEDGVDNATVHQGYPAFLGVSVQSGSTGGAAVADVVSGGPADQAGLVAGDVLTGVGGRTISTADDVSAALAGHAPGDRVTVSWTDAAGAAHSAGVPLATGPAD